MNGIPDFQPVAWSLFYWATSIMAPALHKVHGIQTKKLTQTHGKFYYK